MAMDSAQVVFSHAEANRSYIEARVPPGRPIHIIRRGIPLSKDQPQRNRDPDLWITASALVKAKNVAAVLQAFAFARSLSPNIRLLICGEGPERAELEQVSKSLGCSDAVTFRGHVGREELFELMHGAGTFLMLSKKPSERLPNVVKEALWSGCSVVTSNSEGIEELIPDEGIGQIVDPDDRQALEAAVALVLNESAAAAQERRLRARKLIADSFSSADSMSRYVAAWRSAAANQALGVPSGESD
jgi:glycosyltransferase involved in cell wall biosynthesis